MTASLAPLLKKLRRIAEPFANETASDVDLLVQFARSRSEVAFAALVQRHGPMVRSVCRRVLGDSETADEVFQATFLILARKANSLAQPAALAGWLHGVASRTARKARALQNARRMVPLPADVAQPGPCTDPLAEITARELLTIVDEEIAGLPERFRLPIILCCLEGHTQEEAAQRLGWSPGSVKGRLERGRARLHARLRRRGVILPAALVAFEVSRVTAALPAPLIAGLTQAACKFAIQSGSFAGVSHGALYLAQTTLRDLTIVSLSRVLLAIALVAIVGAGVAAWRGTEAPSQEPSRVAQKKPGQSLKPVDKSSETAYPEADSARRVSVEGHIVDATGKPVQNAAVYLREQPLGRTGTTWNPAESRNIADTKSDADGRFALRDVALLVPLFGRKESFYLDLVVQASGHALAWRHLDAVGIRRPVEFALAPEAKVQGRLLDRIGKPLANVTVRVAEIAGLDHEWMAPLHDPGYVDLRWAKAPLTTRSDAGGRLQLPGLPRNARITLTVIEPGYARQDVLIGTTDTPQPPLELTTYGKSDKPAKTAAVHHGDFTATVDKAFQLHAHVVFDDTGKPAVGARWAEPPITSPATRDTDAMARLAMNQLAPGKFSLRVFPPEGSDYLGVETRFDLQGEPRVLEPTIRLPRGVILQGRVLEEGTGKGIAAAEVQHFLGKFDTQEGPTRLFAFRARTDAEGMFRLAVPPTKGNLILHSVPRGYRGHDLQSGSSMADAGPRFLKTLDASGKVKPASLEFVVSRGAELRGHTHAPDGSAVRVTRLEELELNPDRQVLWTATPAGEFQLGGLQPGAQYQFALIAPERGLATVLDMTAPNADAKPAPLRIKLEPMASLGGRVTDENGVPLAKAVVRISEWKRTRSGQEFGSVSRDPLPVNPDGTFLWKELIPGVKYYISVRAEGYVHANDQFNNVSWTAAAGKVHTLPDLRMALKEE